MGNKGVFSVTGAVLAIVIAVEIGFVWVMVFAISSYSLVLANSIRKV